MEILHLENVSFRYPKAAVNALDGVSFSVQSGEFVVVCGASGCGCSSVHSRLPVSGAAKSVTGAPRSLRFPSAPRRARSGMCCKTPTARS